MMARGEKHGQSDLLIFKPVDDAVEDEVKEKKKMK